ncbi:DUF6468 domain-containing protein [Brevundimonas sp. NIBR11]|uniref:DUF6468 domain-containing protein n=1 Tax=Brevundimonas sp. NIBR11 TaxID=3015999 RepID=UPI0022F0E720|nr:DUF6468 domain-containing protein [Brevundimonas sp. NIBR11]WGM31806.1 hypothetical protein KKHFBJBL_02055 [Brevundimonas sp. NIBR11]
MTGMILDAVLMLLLVAALGYGVRLEKKLTQLRAGQLAFAGAVTELNAACTRAENALGSLRASGEEADLLHDRILKARALKADLEQLMARSGRAPLAETRAGPRLEETRAEVRAAPARPAPEPAARPVAPVVADPDDRAFRMAALAERIHGLAAPAPAAAGAGNVQAILHALTANQAAKQSLNRARVNLAADDDLFAA